MEATVTGNGAVFVTQAFTFNGDDALAVRYGGTATAQVFAFDYRQAVLVLLVPKQVVVLSTLPTQIFKLLLKTGNYHSQ